MPRFPSFALPAIAVVTLASVAIAQNPTPPAGNPPAAQGAQGGQGGANARRPRPYAQVIPERAHSEHGGVTVHKVDDRWFFEVPDSLLGRDILFVSRIASVPAGESGMTFAGSEVTRRMVRWEKVADRLQLHIVPTGVYAADSLPIAISVRNNNYGPILAAFPIQAYSRDSTSYVLDVTDFFSGDVQAISGLTDTERRQYQVRRMDPARSYVSSVRSFPINIEVRQIQTFDAGAAPGDRLGSTISLEMRQSLLLLPKVPMRPRLNDQRVGFFTVNRVNYGLDEQKAATETFITRWRLEPKDPAAYARGELVEPIKPIVYYIDPATPTKWRRYVKEGVESWQKVFEKAGFKNAIIAKDPPTKAEDPDWDPDDARYSMVRWAASLVRNAIGPSTPDPRSGEIINSEINWYHNHMRSYRNRLLIETGVANPEARTMDIPEDLMGETMRQVIAHEIGHALGLQHNMAASFSFPVDSLRSPTFTSKYGVSATIMDYARQNYVAQPGDGLKPKDFIRRLGPFDDFIINWGYRIVPNSTNAYDERKTLNDWLVNQKGPMPYYFVPGQYGSIDPRSQTEDMSNDQVRASGYAIANMKKLMPQMVSWTTKPGNDYTDLNEIYDETLNQWGLYMGHVVGWIGGVTVDMKSADQGANVYKVVPKARQKTALAFLNTNALSAQPWLTPTDIISRIGPSDLANRQATVLTNLLQPARLGRLAESEETDPANAYPLAEYLSDLEGMLFAGATPDATHRELQRVYIERLNAILHPPAPAAGAAGAGGGRGGGGGGAATPFSGAGNVPRSDIPALARLELTKVRDLARRNATAATGAVSKAHWADLATRAEDAIDPKR